MDRSQYPVPIVQEVFLQCPVEIKGTVDFQLVMVEGYEDMFDEHKALYHFEAQASRKVDDDVVHFSIML